MEKKKLVRFSLEDWLTNPKQKVVTQDGRDVRILCVDRLDEKRELPVVALVAYEWTGDRSEALCEFDAYGMQNGNDYDNGWILYFEGTYEDNLADELLENGFRPFRNSADRDFYKTINAGSENKYELFVNATQKTASYMRVGQDGEIANARMLLKEGTTCAEIQEWAEKINKAIQ